ncbi:hypothetical protein XAP6164_890006 [Xanthomonas phaseoli pv. phaseoli]|nr:hypothetical protein XAP6164_890006 [Xanthomonas phaseoli pv. phaseoli]
MADALYQRTAGLLDQLGNQRITCLAILRCHLHLDQFVALEHFLEFCQKCRRDPFAAGLQQGFEVVGLTAQETVLGGGENNGHAGSKGSKGCSGYHGDPFGPLCQCLPAVKAASAGSRNTSPTLT